MKMFLLILLIGISVYGFDLGKLLDTVSQPKSVAESESIKQIEQKQAATLQVDGAYQFLLPGNGFNKQMALFCADFAKDVFYDGFGKRAFSRHNIPFDGHKSIEEGLTDLQFAYGHKKVGPNTELFLITIRGSKETKDWIADLNYTPTPYSQKLDQKITVHRGFLNNALALQSIQKEIILDGQSLQYWIEQNVKQMRKDIFLITGHSLGGAIATLYTTMLVDQGLPSKQLVAYTYGAPPISMDEGTSKESITSSDILIRLKALGLAFLDSGNVPGKNYYIERYQSNVNLHRIFDKNDLVPRLLPPARHLGTEKAYQSKLSFNDLKNYDKVLKKHYMNNYIALIQEDKFAKENSTNDLLIEQGSQLMKGFLE